MNATDLPARPNAGCHAVAVAGGTPGRGGGEERPAGEGAVGTGARQDVDVDLPARRLCGARADPARPGPRFVAWVVNATRSHAPSIDTSVVGPSACAPSDATDTRWVTFVRRSRTKASGWPFVSPATRFDAEETNATQCGAWCASPSSDGFADGPLAAAVHADRRDGRRAHLPRRAVASPRAPAADDEDVGGAVRVARDDVRGVRLVGHQARIALVVGDGGVAGGTVGKAAVRAAGEQEGRAVTGGVGGRRGEPRGCARRDESAQHRHPRAAKAVEHHRIPCRSETGRRRPFSRGFHGGGSSNGQGIRSVRTPDTGPLVCRGSARTRGRTPAPAAQGATARRAAGRCSSPW